MHEGAPDEEQGKKHLRMEHPGSLVRHDQVPCALAYWMALPTEEKTLLAFDPIIRIVPTTTARMTARMTAYSATSCPSSASNLHNACLMLTLAETGDFGYTAPFQKASVVIRSNVQGLAVQSHRAVLTNMVHVR